MRIAVYDRYWATAGGGEKYAAGVAHALAGPHEVTLLAHEPVDTDWLGERLALDLGGVAVELVGEAHRVEAASAAHDVLVNLSFKSTDRNGARRGLYVVHFPHDRFDRIPPRQRRLLERVGPLAGRLPSGPAVDIGAGFHDADVSRVAKVRWSDGAGVVTVALPPGRAETLHLGFAPLLPPGHELAVAVEADGRVVAEGRVGSITARRDLIAPRWIAAPVVGRDDGEPVSLVVRSGTWVPDDALGNGDHRRLGVPLVGVAVGRSPLGRARVAASLFEAYPPPVDFLDSYDRILANSRFTRHWIRRWWDRDADVAYPPVTLRPAPAAAKEPVVLSVGRFFAAERGHSKKQVEMVEAWRALLADPAARAVVEREGWVLHLVGGCAPDDRPYVDQVRAAAAGLPVELHVDAPGHELDRLYRRASIYWHAAGLGEPEDEHPERMEHFGITTVEAMSAGAVPVAYAAAGPLEAFTDGIEGRHFRTVDELVAATTSVLADPERRTAMQAAAAARAERFGLEAFGRHWRALVDDLA